MSRLCPSLSTGLSCGRTGHPVLLRGLQEVIERDALMGAWWGHYPVEEWDAEEAFALLGPLTARRVRRPNLRYRFLRVVSPFSSHAVFVTLEGIDREGYCFSAGAACRETRIRAWEKALIEAIHGRHYVRHLLAEKLADQDSPRDFAGHAAYYSRHPGRLKETLLGRPLDAGKDVGSPESLAILVERLGTKRRILCRLMTPPGIVAEEPSWVVVKVMVPGLQPMHGDHLFPFLGGPLWGNRPLADWAIIPPHPFP